MSVAPELEAGRTQLASTVEEQTQTPPIRPYAAAVSPRRRQWRLLFLAIASLTLLGIDVIAYRIWHLITLSSHKLPDPSPIAPTTTPLTSATPTIAAGQFFQAETPLPLQTIPQVEVSNSLSAGAVPSGSTVKVLQVGPSGTWLELQVCQSPPPSAASSQQENLSRLSAGQSGWIKANYLGPVDITPISVTGQFLGLCSVEQE